MTSQDLKSQDDVEMTSDEEGSALRSDGGVENPEKSPAMAAFWNNCPAIRSPNCPQWPEKLGGFCTIPFQITVLFAGNHPHGGALVGIFGGPKTPQSLRRAEPSSSYVIRSCDVTEGTDPVTY